MSSFKEIKKTSNVKVWENKCKRLYASEELTASDSKFLNIQFDLYSLRKQYIFMLCGGFAIALTRFPYIKNLNLLKKFMISSLLGYYTFSNLRLRNRKHFETIIGPYFEKYYIK